MAKANNMVKVQENSNWDSKTENEVWVEPLVNIFETEDEYSLNAIMPGVSRNDVKVKIESGSLVLMGKINKNDLMDKKYILKEIEMGNYYRKFNLSDSINIDKIQASFQDGILTINLPKTEKIKPKIIQIK